MVLWEAAQVRERTKRTCGGEEDYEVKSEDLSFRIWTAEDQDEKCNTLHDRHI